MRVFSMNAMLGLLGALLFLASCGSSEAVKAENESSVKAGVYKKDKIILFVYKPTDPSVTNVAITGDFNGWMEKGMPLKAEGGVFKITLTLDYGTYQYKYILNGSQKIEDPTAEAHAPDGMGGMNSIVDVTPY